NTPTASGDTVGGSIPADVAPVQVRQSACSSHKRLNLLRGVICQVTRALAFSNRRSEDDLPLRSGAYNHFAGSAALGLCCTFGLSGVLPPRCAGPKSPRLSLASGPPMVPETSYTFLNGLGAVTPRLFRSGVRLSDWNFSPVPLKNTEPCVALPPLFGT